MAKRKRRTAEQIELEEKGRKLLEEAESFNFEDNYFFKNTLLNYQTQLRIIAQLKEEIDKGETLIEKEYVKGRKNVCINPCITEYNKTVTAANQTALTLTKLLETAKGKIDDDGGTDDPLMKALGE